MATVLEGYIINSNDLGVAYMAIYDCVGTKKGVNPLLLLTFMQRFVYDSVFRNKLGNYCYIVLARSNSFQIGLCAAEDPCLIGISHE